MKATGVVRRIDELGRILPKLKVDSTFTGNSKIVSNSSVTSKTKQKMRPAMKSQD